MAGDKQHALGHLHLHTSASDGNVTLDMIRDARLDFVAATDHDTTEGYEYLKPLAAEGIEVISGIELSARWRDRKFHLVVLDLRPGPGFNELLGDLTRQRRDRYDYMLEHLTEKGFNIRRLDPHPEQPPYKHEIAEIMMSDPANRGAMEQHAVRDARDFRKRYLKSGPSRITMKGVPMEDVVQSLGGIYILAHPGEKFTLPDEIPEVEDLLRTFKFHGIETVSRKHTGDDNMHCAALAQKFGLVTVTSNDVHEPWHMDRNFATGDQLAALRAAAITDE